jgi:hypothetical protein
MQFFMGLDLGQTTDPTALVIVERPKLLKPTDLPTYGVRYLQRFKLGTSYTDIVEHVRQIVARPILKGSGSILVVDQTGVGRAVVDLMRAQPLGVGMIPVTITAGQQTTIVEDGAYHVPKKDLVSTLQVLLQNRRLKIAPKLPEAATLEKELQNFKVKITPAINEVFGCWREGVHDDLVLAVALACWFAERSPAWHKDSFGVDKKSLAHTTPRGVFTAGPMPARW